MPVGDLEVRPARFCGLAGSRRRDRKRLLLRAALLSALLVLTLGAPSAHAAAGDLDPTFHRDGKRTTDFNGEDFADAVVVQPDGRVVVGGRTSPRFGPSIFALARYTRDGNLDPFFDFDGKVTTDVDPASNFDVIYAMALQPDGKIVAGGNQSIARYLGNGRLDNSFSGDGKQTLDPNLDLLDFEALAVAPDGKIVVAGAGLPADPENPNFVFGIGRYNSDGSLDTSFGEDGVVTIDPSTTGLSAADGVVVQPDGKIVAAGYAGERGNNSDFALARLNVDGSPDTSFSGDGVQRTDLGAYDEGEAVVLQPDGKLVVAGRSNLAGSIDFWLARYQPDGSLDRSFSRDGLANADFGGTDFPRDLALQPGGSYVVAGYTEASNRQSDFALARFAPDGSLDRNFSGDGLQTTDFGGDNDRANGVAIAPDAKIVAAGYTDESTGDDFAVARYQGVSPASGPPPAGPGPPPKASSPLPPPASCPPGSSAGVSCQPLPGGGRLITGTAGNDTIRGTNANDVINCGDGDDLVHGGGGNDVIRCGNGRDRISGNPGDDRIFGEAGNDRISGDSDNDSISGGTGNDRAIGASGRDRLNGNSGDDILHGNSSNDSISGSSGRDRISGNSGNDRLSGNAGNDRISGDSGNDRLNGGSGRDRLSGASGNDAISARDRTRDSVRCGTGGDRVTADRRRGRDRVARECERVRRR